MEQLKAQGDVEMFAVLNEDVCIDDSLHECFVRAKLISNFSCDYHDKDFVFTPDNSSLSEKGLMVAHAIVRPRDMFIPVRIIKPECGKAVLKTGTRIGRLEHLNSAEGFYEDVRMCGLQENQSTVSAFTEKLQVGELPKEQRCQLMHVLREFKDVFSSSKMDIGCTPLAEHHIDTGDVAPIAVPLRRISIALEEKVDQS